MEALIHMWNGLLVIIVNIVLAAIAWLRLRQNLPVIPAMRAGQGIAHLLLLLQVLLGIGMLARGRVINPLHPIFGVIALLALFLPLLLPNLRTNRALAAAVTPTVVAVLALITYAIAEMR